MLNHLIFTITLLAAADQTTPPDTSNPKYQECQAQFDANQMDRHSARSHAMNAQDYYRTMNQCMAAQDGTK